MGTIFDCCQRGCKVCVLEAEQEKRGRQGKQRNCPKAELASMLEIGKATTSAGCPVASRFPFLIRVIVLATLIESDEAHITTQPLAVSRTPNTPIMHKHHPTNPKSPYIPSHLEPSIPLNTQTSLHHPIIIQTQSQALTPSKTNPSPV